MYNSLMIKRNRSSIQVLLLLFLYSIYIKTVESISISIIRFRINVYMIIGFGLEMDYIDVQVTRRII